MRTQRPLPTPTPLTADGASQGFDNDDGSSWYDTHDNFFYDAAGFKMDVRLRSSSRTQRFPQTRAS